MNYKDVLKTGLLFLSMTLVFSCSKDDDEIPAEEEQTYTTEVAVTDAPIDNANVEAAFVTIANVQVNGKAIEGFEKTTVDLLALQNGTIEALGNIELESGTTTDITLELDHDTNADGSTPGSYIETVEGEPIALASGSTTIALDKMAEVKENNENRVVLDFDLRKLIVLEDETNSKSFSFVSESEMESSVRAVNEADAGVIEGTVEDSDNTADKIVVFAYKEGEFDAESESQANAAGEARFGNAVNSAVVKEDGSYELHFIEKGDYELHYASYSENAEGRVQFETLLDVDAVSDLGLDLLGFNVGTENRVEVNVSVKGEAGVGI